MSEYPRGACSDASMLLGAFLADCGFIDFDYVSGHRGNMEDNSWSSHAWLQAGEMVIDITAGQFEDAPEQVIVALPSSWHQQFEVVQREQYDFRSFSKSPYLIELYSRIKTILFLKDQKGTLTI